MNVVLYTLTRDRLAFTQACFARLEARAGYPYRHVVLDNGSLDESASWLRWGWAEGRSDRRLVTLPRNVGISRGSNACLDLIVTQWPDTDLVVKVDNDCLVQTDGVLARLVEIFEQRPPLGPQLALSPRVEGIVHQPQRVARHGVAGHEIGETAIIGGLCHAIPWSIYRTYRYPVTLPLARGQDDHLCAWLRAQGVLTGYVEDLVVEHYQGTDGQARTYPEYFARKHREEEIA